MRTQPAPYKHTHRTKLVDAGAVPVRAQGVARALVCQLHCDCRNPGQSAAQQARVG